MERKLGGAAGAISLGACSAHDNNNINMYNYVCIYMYVCTICMYVCMHYMYVCMYVLYVCMYVCMYVFQPYKEAQRPVRKTFQVVPNSFLIRGVRNELGATSSVSRIDFIGLGLRMCKRAFVSARFRNSQNIWRRPPSIFSQPTAEASCQSHSVTVDKTVSCLITGQR